MSHRRNIALAITLSVAFLAPSSAPAADTFAMVLGDYQAGIPRITASTKGGIADIYLQPCSPTIKSDCIQSVAYQEKTSSDWITLVPEEKIVFPAAGVPRFGSSPNIVVETLTAHAADAQNNFPAAGMTPVYRDSRKTVDDGVRYLVQARAYGQLGTEGKYDWFQLAFDIKPVTVVDYLNLNQFGFPTLRSLSTFQNADNFKVEVNSKATRNIFAGWFYGRIYQPEIKTTFLSEDETVVEIIGSPIVTHLAQGQIAATQYAAIQSSVESALPTLYPQTSTMFLSPTYGSFNALGAMKAWQLLSPLMDERARSSTSVFNFNTAKSGLLLTDLRAKGCLASASLDGVVSTNATMYNPAPPTYNAADESLNFEVGSPHLEATGAVIQGFYSMVVSAKIANCIWGSDLTNSKATVSIINESGTAQVSTSVLKFSNGFYNFHISGFTYSTKKISIRVVPAAAPAPSPTVSPSTAVKQKPTIKRITCVKGQLKKVVSGVKPVCPKGYKLK